MHGGIITTGRLCTVGVDGAYWISSISSLRKTTSPGVTARSRPTTNASASLIEMRPRAASATRFAKPRARLAPSVSDRARDRLGIGREEVRRRERVDPLAREEAQAALLLRRQAGRLREFGR